MCALYGLFLPLFPGLRVPRIRWKNVVYIHFYYWFKHDFDKVLRANKSIMYIAYTRSFIIILITSIDCWYQIFADDGGLLGVKISVLGYLQ